MASTKKAHKKSKGKITSRTKVLGTKSQAQRTVSKLAVGLGQKFAPYYYSLSSIFLILAGTGLIFMLSVSSLNLDWRNPYAHKPQTVAGTTKISPKPQTLYIPKLSRVLGVSDGEVVGDRWTISQTGVSYLKTTPTPGTKGNSVLYGHNLQNILGDLYLLQKGDSIYVVSGDGNFVKYQVFETKEVTPESVEILNATKDNRLTLYTCSGFLDTARYVVVAKQIQV